MNFFKEGVSEVSKPEINQDNLNDKIDSLEQKPNTELNKEGSENRFETFEINGNTDLFDETNPEANLEEFVEDYHLNFPIKDMVDEHGDYKVEGFKPVEKIIPFDERFKYIPQEFKDYESKEFFCAQATGEDSDYMKEKFNTDRLYYDDANPVFYPFSIVSVEIEGMSSNRYTNFVKADEALADKWNKEGHLGRTDWSPREIAGLCKENSISRHEDQDEKTVYYVDSRVHEIFSHSGGRAACQRREMLENGGSDFDSQFDK